jgi:hypothetical protein
MSEQTSDIPVTEAAKKLARPRRLYRDRENALKAEIRRLRAEIDAAPVASPDALQAPRVGVQQADAPAYRDDDTVPEWTTPATLCGFRLDEEVTIASEKRTARTFRPGSRYTNVPYGMIRQALALWGAYADARQQLLIDRGIGRGRGPSLGEWDLGS